MRCGGGNDRQTNAPFAGTRPDRATDTHRDWDRPRLTAFGVGRHGAARISAVDTGRCGPARVGDETGLGGGS
ncbi:hypothetical protein BRC68_10195 [Halobacteriales archaeon QH_6_64_20]|nr:MAG: hypothetical protein BRC68_10195 [Halobacteriales archaeon QH_6_64_20]